MCNIQDMVNYWPATHDSEETYATHKIRPVNRQQDIVSRLTISHKQYAIRGDWNVSQHIFNWLQINYFPVVILVIYPVVFSLSPFHPITYERANAHACSV